MPLIGGIHLVEEDIYELINDSTTSESNTNLILMVKEVDKFNIETHKYINNLKLIIDGKENNYFYKEAEKVVQNIKSFKNISGEIDYRIVVKNNWIILKIILYLEFLILSVSISSLLSI